MATFINYFKNFFDKYNVKQLSGAFVLFMLGFFMCFNTDNLDYGNYLSSYELLNHVKGFEYGYYFLQVIGRFFSLGFPLFRFLIYFFGLVFIHKLVKRYTDNTAFFYILYFLYPFFLDTIEIRNFIGMILLMYGFCSLMSDTSYHRTKFVLYTIVASLFHTMFILFIPFVFMYDLLHNKKQRFLYFYLVCCGVVLVAMPNAFIDVLNDIICILSPDSGRDYLEHVSTRYGHLLMFAELLLNIFIFYVEYEYIKNKNVDKKIKVFVELNFVLSIYCLLFMPLFRIHGQFTRTLQDLMIFKHLCNLVVLNYNKTDKDSFVIFAQSIYLIYVIYLFGSVIIQIHFDDIFLNILSNNLFFVKDLFNPDTLIGYFNITDFYTMNYSFS